MAIESSWDPIYWKIFHALSFQKSITFSHFWCFLDEISSTENMGFSRLRKKSSHIYIIIIIFLFGGLQAPIIRQSYITEHISHCAASIRTCQMNKYVHSQIVKIVVKKLLCPIAFWVFGLGFWEFQKYQISDFKIFMRFSDTIDDQISNDMLKIG